MAGPLLYTQKISVRFVGEVPVCRIRLVVWVSGFHPEGESSILSCGTKMHLWLNGQSAGLRNRRCGFNSYQVCQFAPSSGMDFGLLSRKRGFDSFTGCQWSRQWTAPDPPKVRFPGSNPGGIAKCAPDATGRHAGLKNRLFSVRIRGRAPNTGRMQSRARAPVS